MNTLATTRLSERYLGIVNGGIHQLCPAVPGIKQLVGKVFGRLGKDPEVEGNRLNFWRVVTSGTTVAPTREIVLDPGGAELSQFGAEKFTTRSREVIEAAQLAATTGGNTTTEPIHLLVALLRQEDGTSRSLVQKAGVEPGTLLAQAEGVQQQLPRATGSTV